MTPELRTGGEAIVDALLLHGVDTLFGLPGIQNDWLYNALFDARDRIRVVHTRHEQGAAYMALGFALARGDVAAYNVVPGPGFLNTTAALATAYALNAPVLCLTGQIPRGAIGRELGVLHEIPDQLGIMRSLTKWAARITSPEEAPGLVGEAFRQLRSGRPRPVGLEVPMDVLAERRPVTPLDACLAPERPQADPAALDEAAVRLRRARNPLIFVGSGAQGVSDEVRQLAEWLQAPVVSYRTGRGVLDSRHYLSLVQPQAHPLWKDVDVALAIGSNMRVPLRDWGVDDKLTLIRIDVDPTSHTRYAQPAVAITARAEDALPLLIERLGTPDDPRVSRRDEMRSVEDQWLKARAFLSPQIGFLEPIRHALGEDGILVDELTQVGFSARVLMPVYKPRTFISTGYQGTLGYGFQTAPGCEGCPPECAGHFGDRRRRLHVRRAGTGDGRAAWYRSRDHRLQQQPVRQRAAHAADALWQSGDCLRPAQPRLPPARRVVWRSRGARRDARGARARPRRSRRSRWSFCHRGTLRRYAGR